MGRADRLRVNRERRALPRLDPQWLPMHVPHVHRPHHKPVLVPPRTYPHGDTRQK